MAINRAMKLVLKALSYPDLDIKKNYKIKRKLIDITHPYNKPLYKAWDHKIAGLDHDIPVRIFMPSVMEETESQIKRVLIFYHGGGFVIGNIDSYSAVCANLADRTESIVVSVDYRLAPEYKFPAALEDCYTVTREIFQDSTLFPVDQECYTLIGDSAGGNLAAAVSLMARDRGEFLPSKQILLYPSTWNDHSTTSPFPSIHENGSGYLLTTKRINDYLELYQDKAEDRYNPYFAPLLSGSLEFQPKTLIITAEYDPLRDEGEAYANRLREAGNEVLYYCMKDALHGFITLPKNFTHVKKSYEIMNQFLEEK